MKLDVTPIHDDSCNCFEDAIITILNYYKYNYEFLFIDSWRFKFNSEESGLIGLKINLDRNNTFKLLEYYYGITFNLHNIKDFDTILNTIKNEIYIYKKPLIIVIDNYYVPWSLQYKIAHTANHIFLIVGIEGDNLICVDSYLDQKHDVCLSINEFKDGVKCIYTNREIKKNVMNIKDIKWESVIENTLLRIQGKDLVDNAFYAIRCFADDIDKLPDLKSEIGENSNFWSVPLVNMFDSISKSRRQYSKFINYLATVFDLTSLFPISDKLYHIAIEWTVVRALILKCFLLSNTRDTKNKIVSKIRKIADYEESIYYELKQACTIKDKVTKIKELRCEKEDEHSENFIIISLDLSKYFNNKGFNINLNDSADISYAGHFFLADDKLLEEKICIYNGISFSMLNISNRKFDNISCEGQEIAISCGHYNRIFLLGCSISGSFTDKIIFKCEDNEYSEVNFGFTDWLYSNPLYGESVVWQGRGAQRLGEHIVPIIPPNLFAKEYCLKTNKSIRCLALPNNPFIHIFAISLST